MKSVVIIPARYQSTRFPGKPLIPLCGKPMILWVAELSSLAVGLDSVYVATDDERIAKVVTDAGFNAIVTQKAALTGTDRLAEAAEQLEADIIINVQGDEPLLDPEDIRKIIQAKKENMDCIINGFCDLSPGENPDNVNIPKVITTESGKLVYMSRKALPGFKDKANEPRVYKKQVCIYAFTKEELKLFIDFGRKSELEKHEDIEILRFLDIGKTIRMVRTSGGSLAVDVEEDIAAVEKALTEGHG